MIVLRSPKGWTGPREVDGVQFINTGSVGRPKDGDWRAGYVLIDADGQTINVDVVRVQYDVNGAVAGLEEAALPREFAEVLRNGG